MTREEVVQAALTVERWCREQNRDCRECPFRLEHGACVLFVLAPRNWELEEFLRTRGLKHDD